MLFRDPLTGLKQAGILHRSGVQIPDFANFHPDDLSSERTRLLPFAYRDQEPLFDAVESSRESLENWLPWVPNCCDVAGAERYILSSQADWQNGRAFRFAIRRTGDPMLIGALSFENVSRHHRHADLGYWLRRSAWGQGLASDACALALKFAFKKLGLKRLSCAAGSENLRSLKLIEALGFCFEGIARQAEFVGGRYVNHRVYSLLDDEYRLQQLDLLRSPYPSSLTNSRD